MFVVHACTAPLIIFVNRLRPIEVALLLVGGFCLLRAGRGVLDMELMVPGDRSGTVAATMLMVATISVARQFLKLPWLPGHELGRRMFQLGTIVAVLPLMFLAAVLFTSKTALQFKFVNVPQFIYFANDTLKLLGLMCPTVLAWLFFGIDAKTHPTFSAVRYLKERALGTASALREWLPIVICIGIYPLLDGIVGTPTRTYDATMNAADIALFGIDPRVALERIISTPLSEWLAFAYTFFAALFPLVIGACYWKAGLPALRDITFTLGFGLLLSYLSYTLIPVGGPLLVNHYETNLDFYILEPVKEALMDKSRISWDCFPSMHTGDTVVLCFMAYRYVRRLFWVILPIAACIPFACVYLRYHYVVDVIAGFAFAALLIVGSRWLRPKIDPSYEAAPA